MLDKTPMVPMEPWELGKPLSDAQVNSQPEPFRPYLREAWAVVSELAAGHEARHGHPLNQSGSSHCRYIQGAAEVVASEARMGADTRKAAVYATVCHLLANALEALMRLSHAALKEQAQALMEKAPPRTRLNPPSEN